MQSQLDIIQILWHSGLVVKFVLLLLVLCSLFSWAIVIQKMKEFKRIKDANKNFLQIFGQNASLNELFQMAENQKDSVIGVMYKKGYEELNRLNERLGDKKMLADYLRDQNFVPLERALKQGAYLSQEKLDLRVSTLATIGSITPFIGLFGTVWGIIDAFSGLAKGGGSIEAVAPGIAEALVATAVGLAAAIPAVWFYNLFSSKIAQMNSQMEAFSQDFLNVIERSILSLK